MRLAVFTSQFPGRVNTFFARDIRALLEAGIEVEIFTLYPLDSAFWQYVPEILNETVFPREKVHHLGTTKSLVRACRFPSRLSGRVWGQIGAAAFSALKFGVGPLAKTQVAVLKAIAFANSDPGRFDHVLAYWGNYAATSAMFFNNFMDKPLPFSMILHAGTDLYRTQVYLREKLIYADNIFVVCDFNQKFIRELYPDIYAAIAPKIHLHHLGLELAELAFTPDGRLPHTVLGVGRLDHRKGFDVLLRAAAMVAARGIRVNVALAGDGEEKENLRRLAEALGIADRVRFLGWLPFDEVRAQMSQATMLVHPSIGLGDAVPTVIKEAMAVGAPVIGSDAVGIPELLDYGRCGLLVPPRDATALANAVEQLLSDADLRNHYATAARAFVETRFNLWDNGRQLAQNLRDTTKRKREP